jgi:hypothetical protein
MAALKTASAASILTTCSAPQGIPEIQDSDGNYMITGQMVADFSPNHQQQFVFCIGNT